MKLKMMNEDEAQEVIEYHFRKIRRLCQEYIDKELDYKFGVTDGRLMKVRGLLEKIDSEIERINKITKE